MTYYVEYRGLGLTAHERPDGSWALRFQRGSAPGALVVSLHDTIVLSDKRGAPRALLKVKAFQPRIQYGKFCRSGVVVPEWLEWM